MSGFGSLVRGKLSRRLLLFALELQPEPSAHVFSLTPSPVDLAAEVLNLAFLVLNLCIVLAAHLGLSLNQVFGVSSVSLVLLPLELAQLPSQSLVLSFKLLNLAVSKLNLPVEHRLGVILLSLEFLQLSSLSFELFLQLLDSQLVLLLQLEFLGVAFTYGLQMLLPDYLDMQGVFLLGLLETLTPFKLKLLSLLEQFIGIVGQLGFQRKLELLLVLNRVLFLAVFHSQVLF